MKADLVDLGYIKSANDSHQLEITKLTDKGWLFNGFEAERQELLKQNKSELNLKKSERILLWIVAVSTAIGALLQIITSLRSDGNH